MRQSEPCELSRGDFGKAEAPPRQGAGWIARQAGAAHIRPHRIDGARSRDAHFALQRVAAIAGATRCRAKVIDIVARDRLERGTMRCRSEEHTSELQSRLH